MKLIGLTSSISELKTEINTAYVSAFTRKGVTPIILPELMIASRESVDSVKYSEIFKGQMDQYAERLDALVITGGRDINPETFGKINYASVGCDTIRDYMELGLIEAFVKAGKPIMGICRGFQLLGMYLKMDNYHQHLNEETHDGNERSFTRRQETVHRIYLKGELHKYISDKTKRDYDEMRVNSWHHQGYTLGDDQKFPKLHRGMTLHDWHEDRIAEYEAKNEVDILAHTFTVIEAFKAKNAPIYGVQWHPEEYGPEGMAIQFFIDKYLS